MQYLCKAGQQVRAKAQDSAPDKDRMPLLGAPSLAGQASTGSANAAGWLSTESGQLTLLCLLYQQGLGRSDYWTSTTFQEPSTDIGYKKKKRLAKSGKDILFSPYFASTLPPTSCIPLSIGICPVVEAIRKGGSKFSFHLSETPEFCSNNLFTSIILRKSYINQSVRHSAEAMKSTGRVSRSSGWFLTHGYE